MADQASLLVRAGTTGLFFTASDPNDLKYAYDAATDDGASMKDYVPEDPDVMVAISDADEVAEGGAIRKFLDFPANMPTTSEWLLRVFDSDGEPIKEIHYRPAGGSVAAGTLRLAMDMTISAVAGHKVTLSGAAAMPASNDGLAGAVVVIGAEAPWRVRKVLRNGTGATKTLDLNTSVPATVVGARLRVYSAEASGVLGALSGRLADARDIAPARELAQVSVNGGVITAG